MPQSEREARFNRSDSSRPGTPDSQLTNSLYRANATVDDLTSTLTKFSRAPTPNDLTPLHCCCGGAECENTKAWSAFQSKLESRLILCAEVGQALLEKHEAYVRRHGGLQNEDNESDDESRLSVSSRPDTPTVRLSHFTQLESQSDAREVQLMKDNLALEKRFNTALLHSEIAESANKTLTRELEEARETISRLSLNQAKSAGWESRLGMALQESEDLRQELESERQKSKALDIQLATVKERCTKHSIEIKQLSNELEDQRQGRRELVEEILRDARSRLEMIQRAQLGHVVAPESPEVTQVMESLVADNEALKRDIVELQSLLTESREDVRMLRDELEESKARVSSGPEERSRVFSSPFKPGHRGYMSSWTSSFDQMLSPSWDATSDLSRGQPEKAVPSTGYNQPYEPLTPTTEHRDLSPARSNSRLERKLPPLSGSGSKYLISDTTLDSDNKGTNSEVPGTLEGEPSRHHLLLLMHDKGIQTDVINWTNLLSPSPFARSQGYDDSSSATPPNDGRSECSSLVEGQAHSSTVAALVERVNSLFTRIAQADARTLTNRLRRQHLAGDVAHLSRATVSAILAEVNGLRAQFRTVLEDEKVISTCNRRDLRALLSLFKEIFSELGQMRITLNDVILDPTVASKVSALAMEDHNDEARGKATSRGTTVLGGWIAPISKLFGTPQSAYSDSKGENGPSASTSRTAAVPTLLSPANQKPSRSVPKLGPALGATTTTVNVEFSGGGVGRSMSSALTTVNGAEETILRATTPAPAGSSRTVMDIFAGAPRPTDGDAWIVVSPKPQRRPRPVPSTTNFSAATVSRTVGRRMGSTRLPRNVDAMIDQESAVHDPIDGDEDSSTNDRLLERTLRPRGLSDSSIRSTFLAGEENTESSIHAIPSSIVQPTTLPPHAILSSGVSARQGAYPGQHTSRASVLHALSKTVQAFNSPSSTVKPSELSVSLPSSSREETQTGVRAVSPRRLNLLPSLAGWAATQAGLDREAAESFVGSIREEPHFGHRQWKVDMQGRNI